jgi:aspartate aminotransferase-like enzyme
MKFSVKMADTPQEFEQIHRLNYLTFVEEIPQHSDKTNEQGVLVDKFHFKNTYFVVKDGDEVIGMVCYSNERPFSVDAKIPNLDQFLTETIISPCEVRLLAVKENYRHHRDIIALLLDACIEYAFSVKANDCAVVTAYSKQIQLYASIGFKPIGPMLQDGSAQFQAMMITLADFPKDWMIGRVIEKRVPDQQSYFLTGPVKPFYKVDHASSQAALSHRCQPFTEIFQQTSLKLRKLVNAKYVHITMGNGSLANAIVAAQLSLLNETGLILSNGEFSERLIDHAERANLDFVTVQKSWGEEFSYAEIEKTLQENSQVKWLWTTHCETSTGFLFDIERLQKITETYQVKLVLDCMSSIGTVPVNLSKVFFASCSSAKALGAKTGLSFVFYNHPVVPSQKIPAVFDLGFSEQKNGIPFTISSHLILALQQALNWFDNPGIWKRTQTVATILRKELKRLNIEVLISNEHASPAIVTVIVPKEMNSYLLGEQFTAKGILLNYGSDYLRSRNWMQISLMGHFYYRDVAKLIRAFEILLPVRNAVSVSETCRVD